MKVYAGKRILMLLENNPYPQDGRVRREAQALTAAGYSVTVIAPGKRNQSPSETVDGVRVERFPMPPEGEGFVSYVREYGWAMVWSLWLTLRVWWRERFDVIHAHNPPDLFVLIALLFKPLGVRFVFDHHDLSAEMYATHKGSNRLVYRVLQGFEWLSLRVADHVIATNESYRDVALSRGVSAQRVTVVRNGPDMARVRQLPPDPKLAQCGHIIGYVGEMGEHDGVDLLLHALHHLRYARGRDDFFAILIGTGSAWAGLRELATTLELDEVVYLPGFVSDDDLLRYLSTAAICVDPDPFNSFNDRSTMIKMTEYMALGKPVVCFDLTEHRRTAGEAAVYVRPNETTLFAEQIDELLNDPERCERLGHIARQRAEQRIGWQHQVPCLLEAYEQVFGERNA